MSTLTDDEIFLIHQRLHGMHIPSGLGTEDSACSIAAINLALSGRLTDEIPACMSEVVGQWIIRVQDAMPDEMRNSGRWKNLLPLAAGTGRGYEQERLQIILNWMWATVLPTLQPLADRQGFGEEWQRMTEERAVKAASDAARAAKAAKAVVAAWAAEEAAWAAAVVAKAASDAAMAAARATAAAAAWAAWAAVAAWQSFDPCSVLEKLIEVGK
jgi:hypothetical protein